MKTDALGIRGGGEKERHKGTKNSLHSVLCIFSSGPERLLPYGDSEKEIVLHCKKLNSRVGQRAGIMPQLEKKGRGWERGREDKGGEGKGQ